VDGTVRRTQAALDELGRAQRKGTEQVGAAIEESAKLATAGLDWSLQVSDAWRGAAKDLLTWGAGLGRRR
jgi:hypothetical protein